MKIASVVTWEVKGYSRDLEMAQAEAGRDLSQPSLGGTEELCMSEKASWSKHVLS